jgi:hypothetical protein
LEIYHAAHGQYETYAPIKTITTAELNGKKYLVASFTCTHRDLVGKQMSAPKDTFSRSFEIH